MEQFFNEHALDLILLTAFFICEILAHTTKIKANSLFQLIYGWIKKEKDKLPQVLKVPPQGHDGVENPELK